MAFILSLVLLLSSSDFSQPATWIDSNDLVQEIFHINRADSKNMEQLMELHTRNGELDGIVPPTPNAIPSRYRPNLWAYNEALKQQNPSLYQRMVDFRKIHNELESENIDAMKFIDHLLLTSRGARHGEITQPQETISIVDNFYGLSSTTRDYLMKKFPALRTVFSGRVGVVETPATKAPSVKTTTTASSGTTTTTKTSSSNEERNLVRNAQHKLTELLRSASVGIPGTTQEALSEAFKEVLTTPFPWQLSDLEPIFQSIHELSENLKMCPKSKYYKMTSDCTKFMHKMIDIVDDVLSAAAKLDPKISPLRQTFEKAKWQSNLNDVLQLIQNTLSTLSTF